MIDPTAFPVYFGLYGREPWVAKDGLMFAKIGEEELEWNGGRSSMDVQDGVVAEVSTLVFSPIDIEQFARFWELFDGEFEPLGIGEVHKVFGHS